MSRPGTVTVEGCHGWAVTVDGGKSAATVLKSTFPALVRVVVLVVAFVLTLLSLARDLSGAFGDRGAVLALGELVGRLL
jgi:hypothetical protein